MNDVMKLLLTLVIGYLLGSISTGVILSRVFGHKDIRNQGSGNSGTTNMLRVMGKKFALLTFAGDLLKGIIAVLIGKALLGTQAGEIVGAFGAILGHNFPLYFGFKGGKAVAVTAGIGLYMDWRLFLICIGIYLLAFLIKKTASIASLSGVTFMPITMLILGGFSASQYVVAIAAVAFVWIMHWPNLVRLAHHEEKAFAVKKAENAAKTEK